MSLMRRANKALEAFHESPESVGFQWRLDLTTLLCELLEEHGWTQRKLADEAGVSEAFVSRIINADSNCEFGTAGRLLFALGIREGEVKLIRLPVIERSAKGPVVATLSPSIIHQDSSNGSQKIKKRKSATGDAITASYAAAH